MRRLWYSLREVAWTAVLSVTLSAVGIVLAFIGYPDISLPITGAAIALAVVSTRA
jgi:hypothetical protein